MYTAVHQKFFGYHRCLEKRFPFAIYYNVEQNIIRIYAVLDCRQNPVHAKSRLTEDP